MVYRVSDKEIFIDSLDINGQRVIPAFWLITEIEFHYRPDTDLYPFSPIEYGYSTNPPTLAELVHAWIGKKPDGAWASPEYRELRKNPVEKRYNPHYNDNKKVGEWTSTYLIDNKEIVENPVDIYRTPFDWVIEGGKRTELDFPIPPNGWILRYHLPTGLPIETSKKKKDATEIFGKDVSFFKNEETQIFIQPIFIAPTFDIIVDTDVDSARLHYIGARRCRRINNNQLLQK